MFLHNFAGKISIDMIIKKKIPFLITLLALVSINTAFAQSTSKPIELGITDFIKSEILDETRTINIYLPEEYNPNDTISYPIIYIIDGGVDEDFIHLVGIVRYNTQPWIDRLPKSIVVGIENTNRRRDFTHAVNNLDFIKKEGFSKAHFPQYGESEKYIAFLEKELQPYIENKYKAKGNKTVIGESLAGLLATEILLKHNHLFDTYIIISPSLWWGDEELLKNADNLFNSQANKKIYIGAPSKEEDIKMYNESETFYKALSKNQQVNVIFDYLPDERHSTVIHQAVYNAFKKLYSTTK